MYCSYFYFLDLLLVFWILTRRGWLRLDFLFLIDTACLNVFLKDIITDRHLRTVTTGHYGSTRSQWTRRSFRGGHRAFCPAYKYTTAVPDTELRASVLTSGYGFYSTRGNSFFCSEWHYNDNKCRSHLELGDAFLERIFKQHLLSQS